MTIPLTRICVRCGRQNVSRARYCAQCGLNLAVMGPDEVTRALRRNGRGTGTGLVLFLILLGLFLAAMGSLFRVRPCPVYSPAPPKVSTPYHQRNRPWVNERREEQSSRRWHAEWEYVGR